MTHSFPDQAAAVPDPSPTPPELSPSPAPTPFPAPLASNQGAADQLPLGSPLAEHIGASKGNNPDNVIRILNENEFESFEHLLEIPADEMLSDLTTFGIKGRSATQLKKYCDRYR